jgi:hypothetical protein
MYVSNMLGFQLRNVGLKSDVGEVWEEWEVFIFIDCYLLGITSQRWTKN